MGAGSTASLPLRPCGKLRLLIAEDASKQPGSPTRSLYAPQDAGRVDCPSLPLGLLQHHSHLQLLGPLAELGGHLDLWGRPSRDQRTLVHQAPDYAQGIVQGALCLLQHQLVAAAQQHSSRLALILDAGDLDDLPLTNLQGGAMVDLTEVDRVLLCTNMVTSLPLS